MKHYELMYIVDPNVEEELDGIRQKIEDIITKDAGEITSFNRIGKKRLAFLIDKKQFGTYYLANFSGTGDVVKSLDYFLRLNAMIIRHIILAFSEKELKLRNLTEKIQEEEAERMRLGGKPLGIPTDIPAENVEIDESIGTTDESSEAEVAPAEETVAAEEPAETNTTPVNTNNNEPSSEGSSETLEDNKEKMVD